MPRTILITGSTDGIGLQTAKALAAQGHKILLHGRSSAKLEDAAAEVEGASEIYRADLSRKSDVEEMARAIVKTHKTLDVVINNAGVFKTSQTVTADGFDMRFVVNAFAPLLLTRLLLPIIPSAGRVVNVSSAAQMPVDLEALAGQGALDDFGAYAQSKLALTIWTQEWAKTLPNGPVIVAVNPGSLLASKMVTEGFGMPGNDIQIGVSILQEAALGRSFEAASGAYFDNDAGRFSLPEASAQIAGKARSVFQALEAAISAWQ